MRRWPVPVATFAVPLCLIAELLPIRSYSTADGLAADHVDKIVADSRGFIWFCTPEGLSRFDGYRFKNYGVAEGLPSWSVNTLLETRSGEYLVGTNGGVCRFRPGGSGKFTTYLLGKQFENYVNALTEDSTGRIWCGTARGLFEMLSDHTFRRQRLPAPVHGREWISVVDILEDAGGKLWLATPNGIYVIAKDGSVERIGKEDGLPNERVAALFLDKQGRLWAGGRLVLMRDGKNGGKVGVQQAFKEMGGAFADGPEGALWVGNGSGIIRWLTDGHPAVLKALTRANGLVDRWVLTVAKDRAGNMWAGTEGAGAMKIQPSGFTTFREPDGLASDRAESVLADRVGAVLALTRSEVSGNVSVNIFDGVKFHAMSVKGFSDHPPWWSHRILLQARSGDWWAATAAGLCRYAAVQAADLAGTRPQACYARNTGVYQIFEDSKGRIWASAQVWPSADARLMRWDPATKAISWFEDVPGKHELVSAFAEDWHGNIWMGSQVLYCYDGRQFTQFKPADGVPAGTIQELFVDHGGRLWIASTAGLGLVDNPGSPHFRVRVYKTSDGLASDAINCITEDTAGRIYAGTGNGVDRLDPQTGRIKHFSTADGLAHGEIKVALRDRSGNLWFATTQGFSRLPPGEVRPPAIPSVRITDLRVGRERYPISQVGETRILRGDLQPSQNQFQVEFVGFSDEPEANLRYTYQLEGGESGWQGPGRDHEVNYPGLTPGGYRFLVKAVNSEGQESPAPAEIDFVILPPVWARWWFRLLDVLAFGALLYGAYRYNLNRLLELERVRTRIAADLHDDIGSSLSGMAFLSEAVKQQVGTARPEAFEMASEVAVMARGLARALSDVVWSIDPRRDDLRNVLTRVRQSAAPLEAQGIAWSLHGPAQPERVKLTPQQRHHLYLIFKEALNNIARHAHCASAGLTITVEGRQLRAEIVDDGCGFSPAGEPGSDPEEHGGNGLRNMQLRASQMGGRMRVDAAAGGGVRLELTVPLK